MANPPDLISVWTSGKLTVCVVPEAFKLFVDFHKRVYLYQTLGKPNPHQSKIYILNLFCVLETFVYHLPTDVHSYIPKRF